MLGTKAGGAAGGWRASRTKSDTGPNREEGTVRKIRILPGDFSTSPRGPRLQSRARTHLNAGHKFLFIIARSVKDTN